MTASPAASWHLLHPFTVIRYIHHLTNRHEANMIQPTQPRAQGYLPLAASPLSITASAPSQTAFCRSLTSARVGMGCLGGAWPFSQGRLGVGICGRLSLPGIRIPGHKANCSEEPPKPSQTISRWKVNTHTGRPHTPRGSIILSTIWVALITWKGFQAKADARLLGC